VRRAGGVTSTARHLCAFYHFWRRYAGFGGGLMQAIRTAILNRLQGDATLYPGLVPGGIWDRPIRAGQGQGSTPAAFWIKPDDPARIVRLRESIVILGPNEVDPPSGPIAPNEPVVLRNGFLRLFYYVPATATGKTALDAIDRRVRQLLEGWQAQLSDGPLTVNILEMSEPLDSDEFPGNLVCYRRIVGEYLRAAA
jgi:hypothetical protein